MTDFIASEDFMRLFLPYLFGVTFSAMRHLNHDWRRIHDEYVKRSVQEGIMILHDGKDVEGMEEISNIDIDIDTFAAWQDDDNFHERKMKVQHVRSIIFTCNLKTIGKFSCSLAERLVIVEIPEGVESIGQGAFAGCRSLSSISFPTTLTSIGKLAFSGCDSLISIDLSRTCLNSIHDFAFSNCENLEECLLPESVRKLLFGNFCVGDGIFSATCVIPDYISYSAGLEPEVCNHGILVDLLDRQKEKRRKKRVINELSTSFKEQMNALDSIKSNLVSFDEKYEQLQSDNESLKTDNESLKAEIAKLQASLASL
ncbi:hypothetical protein TrVE_jg4508 [Triparma verrucosa]|uniref:Leucine zipper homeobox-associated domain-containing protein n=1 Tax=Triparma verrucosa TaxID=1606542 RepID=A0A9W7KTW8_9STRA|nr:hypothetical protein TrVE_jg4508 [Triparma verrucosa]